MREKIERDANNRGGRGRRLRCCLGTTKNAHATGIMIYPEE